MFNFHVCMFLIFFKLQYETNCRENLLLILFEMKFFESLNLVNCLKMRIIIYIISGLLFFYYRNASNVSVLHKNTRIIFLKK